MGDLIPFPTFVGRPPPIRMFCSGCGRERSFDSTLAHDGPCSCGLSHWQSWPTGGSGLGSATPTLTFYGGL